MATPTLRLLLAEDNRDDAELQLREIRRFGLRVSHKVVDSAEAFTNALRSFAPDIILSDFSMPQIRRQGGAASRSSHTLETPESSPESVAPKSGHGLFRRAPTGLVCGPSRYIASQSCQSA